MTKSDKPTNDDAVIRRKIRTMEKAAADIKNLAPSDTLLADATGYLRAIEVKLGDTRRRWESLVAEADPIDDFDVNRVANPNPFAGKGKPQVEGRDFALKKKWKTERTYNGPAIIVAAAEATEMGPTDALMDLINADAARLTWRWTDLKKYLAIIGADLRITPKPVTDHDGLDAAMVGEDLVPNGVERIALKREG